MKKYLSIIIAGIIILTGFGASALIKTETSTSSLDELDQSQTVMTENAVIPVGNVPIPENPICIQAAQSFTPTKEILTRVELFIGKNSTATYPLSISIREILTEDDLTVINIDPSQVPTGSFDWVEINFDDIAITTGLTYYIVALTENVTDNYYAWGANNISESYPNGCAWFSIDEGDTWSNESTSSSYPITAKAFGNQGAQPIFEENITWDMCFKTFGMDNLPPETPSIEGPTSGKTGIEYDYTVVSTDPNGDDVFYCVNWDDNTGEVCTGPFASGEEVILSHIWTERGTYTIQVKARDTFAAESAYATLEVSIPRNRIFLYEFLMRFLEQLQNKFQILEIILH